MRKGLLFILILSFGFSLKKLNWETDFQPSHFPDSKYDFSSNPLDENVIELGRTLFYDPILSANNKISCASCHSPYHAFAHSDHKLSHGIGDSIGRRNAPPLFNLAWHSEFQWDGAVNHLDVQPLAPISDPREMGSSASDAMQRVSASDYYRKKFKQAFGKKPSTELMLKAMSQFQLTLISAGSKYDLVKGGSESFTEQESAGEQLFMKHCNTCHTAPLFTNLEFKSNGLAIDESLKDLGKYEITKQELDRLKFKVPSLRNLAYSKPYMHDGRFKSLREILNHYTSIDHDSPHLSSELYDNINMNDSEKADLIAFLFTLNDKEFVFNRTHQFPKDLLNQIKQ